MTGINQQDKSGLSHKQLSDQISSILGAEPPYVGTLHFTKPELAAILNQLEGHKRPENFVLKGERPPKQRMPCEADTQYRKKMSEYIKLNTGVKEELPKFIENLISTIFITINNNHSHNENKGYN